MPEVLQRVGPVDTRGFVIFRRDALKRRQQDQRDERRPFPNIDQHE